MKKFTPLILAPALVLSAVGAPAAHAQSSGSSGSSSTGPTAGEMRFEPPAQPPLGSAYTGSAPLSLLLAALSIGVAARLIVDNVPALREGLDNAVATLEPLVSQVTAALAGTR